VATTDKKIWFIEHFLMKIDNAPKTDASINPGSDILMEEQSFATSISLKGWSTFFRGSTKNSASPQAALKHLFSTFLVDQKGFASSTSSRIWKGTEGPCARGTTARCLQLLPIGVSGPKSFALSTKWRG